MNNFDLMMLCLYAGILIVGTYMVASMAIIYMKLTNYEQRKMWGELMNYSPPKPPNMKWLKTLVRLRNTKRIASEFLLQEIAL